MRRLVKNLNAKSDKELISKEFNAKSVALESTKKELKDIIKLYSEKSHKFEIQLLKLQEFKEEREAGDRQAKRAL